MFNFTLSTTKKYILLGCTFSICYITAIIVIYHFAIKYAKESAPNVSSKQNVTTITKNPNLGKAVLSPNIALKQRLKVKSLKQDQLISQKDTIISNFAKIDRQKCRHYFPSFLTEYDLLVENLKKTNTVSIFKFEKSIPKAHTKLILYLSLLEKKPNITPIDENVLEKKALEQKVLEQQTLKQKALEQQALKQKALEQQALKQRVLELQALKQKALEQKPLYDLALINNYAEVIVKSSPVADSHNFSQNINKLSQSLLPTFLAPVKPEDASNILNVKNILKKAQDDLEYFNLVMQNLTVELDSLNDSNFTPQQKAALKLQRDAAAKAKLPVQVKNSAGMIFRFIPAGTFLMGSPLNQKERKSDEVPHLVTISSPFYLQISEVTSHDNLPLRDINFLHVEKFIQQLNTAENLTESFYALPTEAQFEYASRSLDTGIRPEIPISEFANYNDFMLGLPKNPATLAPNAWGIYDMFGNVKEFCRDRVKSSFFGNSVPSTFVDNIIDPVANDGDRVVLRGGGWRSRASGIRYAAREIVKERNKDWDYGFRLIRIIPPRKNPK